MKFILFICLAALASTEEEKEWEESKSIGLYQAVLIHFVSEFDVGINCNGTVRSDIELEADKVVQCLKDARSSSSFCETFTNHFKSCVSDLLKKTDSCGLASRRGIKRMVVEATIEQAKVICETDGNHLFELFNPCVVRTIHETRECRLKYDKESRNISRTQNKTDLEAACQTWPNVRQCVYDELEHQCPNNITKNTFHDFTDVNVKPCNGILPTLYGLVDFLFGSFS